MDRDDIVFHRTGSLTRSAEFEAEQARRALAVAKDRIEEAKKRERDIAMLKKLREEDSPLGALARAVL